MDNKLPGCYLLIVLGQPLHDDHKGKIIQRVAKGLLSWDTIVTACDLTSIRDALSVDAVDCVPPTSTLESNDGDAQQPEVDKNPPQPEVVLQQSTDRLAVEILLRPQLFTLRQCVKNLLLAPTGHKHIIHAGYDFSGSGSWILQDSTFTLQELVDLFFDPEIVSFSRTLGPTSLHVHANSHGEWTDSKFEERFSGFEVKLNPGPSSVGRVEGTAELIDFLDKVMTIRSPVADLETTSVIGNLRFTSPTLYVFPGGQGDSCLFGVNGFNMLIDGGFSPLAPFWSFVRHLERLDAILITRSNEHNLWGLSTFLKKKVLEDVYPSIGSIICNLEESSDSRENSTNSHKSKIPKSQSDFGLTEGLQVNLKVASRDFLNDLKAIECHGWIDPRNRVSSGLSPSNSSPSLPITLYHKVGHGTLELFVLNPLTPSDQRNLRKVVNDSFVKVSTGSNQVSIPIQNFLSICCLLIWRPSSPTADIIRLLFPGSTTQKQVFDGLEQVKNLEVTKWPKCSKEFLIRKKKESRSSRIRSASPSRLASVTRKTPTPTSSIALRSASVTPTQSRPLKSPTTTTRQVMTSKKVTPKIDTGLRVLTGGGRIKVKSSPDDDKIKESPPSRDGHAKDEDKNKLKEAQDKEDKEDEEEIRTNLETTKDSSHPDEVPEVVEETMKGLELDEASSVKENDKELEGKSMEQERMSEDDDKLISQPEVGDDRRQGEDDDDNREEKKEDKDEKEVDIEIPSNNDRSQVDKSREYQTSTKNSSLDSITRDEGKCSIQEVRSTSRSGSISGEVEKTSRKSSIKVDERKSSVSIPSGSTTKSFTELDERLSQEDDLDLTVTGKKIIDEKDAKLEADSRKQSISSQVGSRKGSLKFDEKRPSITGRKFSVPDRKLSTELINEPGRVIARKSSVEEAETQKERKRSVNSESVDRKNSIIESETSSSLIDETSNKEDSQPEIDSRKQSISGEGESQKSSLILHEKRPSISHRNDSLQEEKVTQLLDDSEDEIKRKTSVEERKHSVTSESPAEVGDSNRKDSKTSLTNESDDTEIVKQLDEEKVTETEVIMTETSIHEAETNDRKNSVTRDSEASLIDETSSSNKIESTEIFLPNTSSQVDDNQVIKQFDKEDGKIDSRKESISSESLKEDEEAEADLTPKPVSRKSSTQEDEVTTEDAKSSSEIDSSKQSIPSQAEPRKSDEKRSSISGRRDSVPTGKMSHQLIDEDLESSEKEGSEVVIERKASIEGEEPTSLPESRKQSISSHSSKAVDVENQEEEPRKVAKRETDSRKPSVTSTAETNVSQETTNMSPGSRKSSLWEGTSASRTTISDKEESPSMKNDSQAAIQEAEQEGVKDTEKEEPEENADKEKDRIIEVEVAKSRDVTEMDDLITEVEKSLHVSNVGQESKQSDFVDEEDLTSLEAKELYDKVVQEVEDLIEKSASEGTSNLVPSLSTEKIKSTIQLVESQVTRGGSASQTDDIQEHESTSRNDSSKQEDQSRLGEDDRKSEATTGTTTLLRKSSRSSVTSNQFVPELTATFSQPSSANSSPSVTRRQVRSSTIDEGSSGKIRSDSKGSLVLSKFDLPQSPKKGSKITSVESVHENVKSDPSSEENILFLHAKTQAMFQEFPISDSETDAIDQQHKLGSNLQIESEKVMTSEESLGKINDESDTPRTLEPLTELSSFTLECLPEQEQEKGVEKMSEKESTDIKCPHDDEEVLKELTEGKQVSQEILSPSQEKHETIDEGGTDKETINVDASKDDEDGDDDDIPSGKVDVPGSSAPVVDLTSGLRQYIQEQVITEAIMMTETIEEPGTENRTFENIQENVIVTTISVTPTTGLVTGTVSAMTTTSITITRPETKTTDAIIAEWGKPMGLPPPPSSSSRPSSRINRREGQETGTPVYVDLAYIPHHGDNHYCNSNFFKRIRARNYVLSSVNPSQEVLDALIEGKKTWPDKEAKVTLIPTHESETLMYWMSNNEEILEANNIEVAPSASRCTVTLQNHDSSCSAYRIEF